MFIISHLNIILFLYHTRSNIRLYSVYLPFPGSISKHMLTSETELFQYNPDLVYIFSFSRPVLHKYRIEKHNIEQTFPHVPTVYSVNSDNKSILHYWQS